MNKIKKSVYAAIVILIVFCLAACAKGNAVREIKLGEGLPLWKLNSAHVSKELTDDDKAQGITGIYTTDSDTDEVYVYSIPKEDGITLEDFGQQKAAELGVFCNMMPVGDVQAAVVNYYERDGDEHYIAQAYYFDGGENFIEVLTRFKTKKLELGTEGLYLRMVREYKEEIKNDSPLLFDATYTADNDHLPQIFVKKFSKDGWTLNEILSIYESEYELKRGELMYRNGFDIAFVGYIDNGIFKTRAFVSDGDNYVMLGTEAEASKFQHVTTALLDAMGMTVTPHYEGTAEKYGNITVLNLYGTWHEMGKQYGQLAKQQLTEVFEFCDDVIEADIGNSYKAESIINVQEEQMPFTIKDFFNGAAETSGLSLPQLYAANAVERVAGLPRCSFVATYGEYTNGDMIIGRNYDYGDIFKALENDVMVTIFHPADGGLSTAIIGYAGEIYAVNAMNEAGFFMELNNGKPSAPMKSPNDRITGTSLLLDVMFELDDFEFLDRWFNTMNCSSSYVINVANDEKVKSYEWCTIGVQHAEVYNETDMLVSTNHYINPDWNLAQPTDETSWNSLTRRENLINQCKVNKGSIDAEKMQQIIDTDIENGGAKTNLTVYQIVAEPGSRMIWVKTAPSKEWQEINLNKYWTEKAK